MKRFTKNMKYVAMMLSLCMVFALGIASEAASAKYKPGVTYVNPATNAKNEYYSVKKIRMSTYSDTTMDVVYPKDASISVSTNKKAMEAMIIERSNEKITDEYYEKAYVTPTRYEYRYYYIDSETGTREQCYVEEETGKYYDYGSYYDEEYGYNRYGKIYVTPTSSEVSYAYYTEPATGKEHSLYKDTETQKYYYYPDITHYENDQTVEYTDNVTPDYEYATATIQLTSTKAGTYKVNVVVNGQKTTVTVYVSTYGNRTYTTATLAGKTVSSVKVKETAKNVTTTVTTDYQVKSKSKTAKLKLKANKGIKITGIVTASLDKNGKAVYKKVKNGKAIQLSQEYEKNARNGVLGSKSRSAKKNTYVYISYKDNYLKTSYTYSVVKKHGVKQIKEVRKASDGKKYTRYYDYGSGHDLTVWSY